MNKTLSTLFNPQFLMAPTQPTTSKRLSRKPTRATLQHLLALLKTGGDFRTNKVRRLKASVKAKRYENELKLSVAVERLLKDLAEDPR